MEDWNKVPVFRYTLKEHSIQGKEKCDRVAALMGAQYSER